MWLQVKVGALGVQTCSEGQEQNICKNLKAGFSLSDIDCHKLLTNKNGVSVPLCDPLIITEMDGEGTCHGPSVAKGRCVACEPRRISGGLLGQEHYMVKTSLSFVF